MRKKNRTRFEKKNNKIGEEEIQDGEKGGQDRIKPLENKSTVVHEDEAQNVKKKKMILKNN